MKLFSGTSNPSLTKKVSDLLKIPLSKTEVKNFDNSEVRVRILDDVTDQACVIIQTTSNPTNSSLMELFFYCDGLKRGEAKKIIGVIPYFGYARQNIQHREGEAVSVNVVIRFLETVGFDEICAFDIHDEGTGGIFSIPFHNLSALPSLATSVKDYLTKRKVHKENIVVASPDQGGVERARIFGEAFFGNDNFSLVVVEKKRDLENIHKSHTVDLHGEVLGKTVILVDDIVTSGGTLLNAASLCLKKGAKSVLAVIVHPDFSKKAPKKIQQSALQAFFTTDTINLDPSKKFDKLKVVSIAPLIAGELKELK
ncbi:hypothetical protein A3G67_03385 [Candidatus Roizmanbacteria bacterium RIFCSPLOWO2_12_FULL_40_12]|uniref:ribose-phosphate diphosphokinase n=1 Tax=Candidatus Roizmanbacteria bacterium RIFCSPLOWO2_01_FULL_40_42 TaxID=1802066 RepID=A0A1F7J5J5_9BACT|nr:MAG: hypothetical protein A2779_03020 [Candidatus Roizmanbacteria bacterium RIFCSPHIGHO2_01_FULL_40_98]OGK28313.1 MAG: hypothetical protein A3C31_00385 [Candidatus Roizmanbacteria bacterium RIFCSPHIGHO2_02_FULL_40_53]OGK30549.1 MAG: hypothetical protein A2W49_03070 [Candidatus Roizmanbacteria bacterium RIFCSPHIGHO2_12_41_18]OGK36963.1 MAG: hypothetical protein A3E69_00645 [Candidatus Roizmanbacteria bacterium RIFCSPHIGHO2_12_FULL_40_130]OGK50869.1 MAG: hypothetical protein A3B50_01155 [Candi